MMHTDFCIHNNTSRGFLPLLVSKAIENCAILGYYRGPLGHRLADDHDGDTDDNDKKILATILK